MRVASRSRGYFILPMVAVTLTIGLALLVHHAGRAFSGTPVLRDAQSVETLNRAKSALIAFAAENAHRPGGLPCPDRDGDGEAELSCDRPDQRIGFLPWQTLRSGDLRDATGHRLWYALSGAFRNDDDIAINSLTEGSLKLHRAGSGADQVVERLVAIVIGPGAPLAGQARSNDTVNRSAWLEGRNAARDALSFESRGANEQFNDTAVALSSDELFDVIDRVVANRLRNEIAPLIRTRVFDAWKMLPYAAPFEPPLDASFADRDQSTLLRGLLPAGTDASRVHWDAGTIAVERAAGGGVLNKADCRRSTKSEVRCDLEYAGPLQIRLSATAINVGYALVDLPDAESDDFGPAHLRDRRIAPEAVNADGRARLIATAWLPPAQSRIRVTLRAPFPVPELTNENVPVATPHSWFARNRWHEVLYYAAHRDVTPGKRMLDTPEKARDDAVATAFRVIDPQGKESNASAALVFFGRQLKDAGKHTVDSLAAYMEGPNADPDTTTFREPTPGPIGNDAVIVLCRAASGCKP